MTRSSSRIADPVEELVADVFARGCTSRETLEDVAGKWAVLALLALLDSDQRFNALRRRVDGVSEKMLSQNLQTLERDGMVIRTVQSTIPPRVEYSLTALGRRVAKQLRGLTELLEGSNAEVAASRATYDERRSSPS